MKSYKLIEWSYPSSPNASRFGFAKTGCYTLHTAHSGGHKTEGGFATLADAKKAGSKLTLPWHSAMMEGWRSHA